jgi:hypothetical protein
LTRHRIIRRPRSMNPALPSATAITTIAASSAPIAFELG